MKHVVSLKHYGEVSANQGIHLANGSDNNSLCGLLRFTVRVEGKDIPVTTEVHQPATCKACGKGLEMLLRKELQYLDISELEQVYDLVEKLVRLGATGDKSHIGQEFS